MTRGAPVMSGAGGSPPDSDRGVISIDWSGGADVARRAGVLKVSASVVAALLRVVKAALEKPADERSLVRCVGELVALVAEYGERAGRDIAILVAQGSVFVGGQLLRATRAEYDGAAELGEILGRVGVAEISIRRDAQASDFHALTDAIVAALRVPSASIRERPAPSIHLRGLARPARMRGEPRQERSEPREDATQAYASAVVIMRRFFDALDRGRYELPAGIKRTAQRLVDLSAGEMPALLSVTAAHERVHDEAVRAVNAAIVSLAMLRKIANDPVLLADVAMAALLFDAGRALFARGPRLAISTNSLLLGDTQEVDLPAVTAVVLVALGRITSASVARAITVYEAHRETRRGRSRSAKPAPVAASLVARVVATARAYGELLTPPAGQVPMAADAAITELWRGGAEDADSVVLRLLVSALGLFRTGSIVRVSTGETGVVVRTNAHPSHYGRPCVRLLLDDNGDRLPAQVEVDLADSSRYDGTEGLCIVEVVSGPDDPAGAELRALALVPDSVRTVRKPVPGDGPLSVRAPRKSPSFPPAMVPSWAPPAPVNLPEGPTKSPRTLRSTMPSEPDSRGPAGGSEEGGASTLVSPDVLGPVEPRVEAAPVPVLGPSDGRPKAPPTAEGSLRKTPFVHLLIYMLDQRLTGTAAFVLPSSTRHAIYFHDGVPTKVRTGTALEPLDRVLIDEGLIDEATLRGTLQETSRRRVLHGRVLVEKGLLDRETLVRTLSVQVHRKVTRLFGMPQDTRYAYYRDENLLTSYGGPDLTPLSPLAAIMAGIRSMSGDPLVDATLGKLEGRALVLHADADIRRFEFDREEQAVVAHLLTRRPTLLDLLETGLAQARTVRLVVYALAITRHLELGAKGKAPVGFGRYTNDAARKAAPSPDPAPAASSLHPAAMTTGAPADAPPALRSETPPLPPRDVPPTETSARGPLVSPSFAPLAFGPQNPTTKLPKVTTPEPSSTRSPGAAGSPNPRKPDAPSSRLASGPTQPPPAPAISTAPEADIDPAARRPTTRISRVPGAATPQPPGVSVAPPSAIDVTPRPPSGAPSRAPGPVTRPPSSRAPAGSSTPPPKAELIARRAEIVARSESVDQQDFFQVLDIERDATVDQIRTSYFALAKSFHPDRLPIELFDLKPDVARVFARISEAYQTLADVEKRRDYVNLTAIGSPKADDTEQVARAVDASLAFQKAEILLKKNNLAGAEQLAGAAAKADPEQPDYLALLIWIRAQRRGDGPDLRDGTTSSRFDDLIQVLDDLLKREPRFERALFYRAQLLKRSGWNERAIVDFRRTAELNPKNIDAVREVRLYDMRKRDAIKRSTPPDVGSLFSKLFKR